MAFTYILFSERLDKFYIGHTESSVEERLQKHLSNHDGFTSKAKDWQVAFIREFEDKSAAFAFERKIKSWKSRAAIEKLISGA
ncbi:MAG: GIY-YIG nuclease family protein [Lewinellaceae bacterium]|nr:GIY-YIG nuclease family protein [Lewinellaceae bacterium]